MKKIFVLGIGSLLFGMQVAVGYAADDTFIPEGVIQAEIIADVSILDAKITEQKERTYTIEFDFVNGEIVQPDVRFSVQLMQPGENQTILIDEKIYGEPIHLGKNETVHQKIVYEVPKFAKGKHQIWIDSQNGKGMSLAMNQLAEIELQGSGKVVFVDPEECYLTVSGETDIRYTLGQGVDVAQSETLNAVCPLSNPSDETMSIIPQMETRFRSHYGNVLDSKTFPAVMLAAKESKSISFEIPKQRKPQAYDAIVTFRDKQGTAISNPVTFHYVIQGASGTVQWVTLDKGKYQPGEQAMVKYSVTPSADVNEDARGTGTQLTETMVQIEIVGNDGKQCTTPQKHKIAPDAFFKTITLNLPINNLCDSPTIQATLTDASGTVLDQAEDTVLAMTLQVDNNQGVQKKSTQASIALMVMKGGIVLFGTLVIILVLRMFYLKWRRNHPLVGFIFLFGSLGYFACSTPVDTATIVIRTNIPPADPYDVTVSLNANAYQPCGTITVCAKAKQRSCGNHYKNNIDVYATINGVEKQVLSDDINPWPGSCTTFTAPSNAGGHAASIRVDDHRVWKKDHWEKQEIYYASIPFSVVSATSCGDWGACSVSCGGGTQSRYCTNGSCGGYWQTQGCNTHACPPANPMPYGWFDGFDCKENYMAGWAVDDSDRNATIPIHFWVDNQPNGALDADRQLVTATAADLFSPDLGAQGLGWYHRFYTPIPDSLKDDRNHEVFPFAIDYPGGAGNPLLSGSPKTINCPGPRQLTVTKTGNGTVTSSLPGINCGAVCSASYLFNSLVNLFATPDADYQFDGWTGACAGNAGCSLTMNTPLTVGATFSPKCVCTAEEDNQYCGSYINKCQKSCTGSNCPEGCECDLNENNQKCGQYINDCGASCFGTDCASDCYCRPEENSEHCQGSYTKMCSTGTVTCQGTRMCPSQWQEMNP